MSLMNLTPAAAALVAVRVVRLALDGVGPGERAAVLRAAAEVVLAVRSGRRGR